MPAPPSRNDIAGTGGSAPSNATARTGFGALWDYVTTLLGASGNAADARTALGLAIGTNVQAYDADIPTVAASQAEMEAGTEAALRSMSPLRIAQAIAALATAGPTVTSWTAFTPTFTGFGTIASSSFFSRRVGDSLEIQGTFVAGTGQAVQAQMTIGTGLTIDSTKVPSIRHCGYVVRSTDVAAQYAPLMEGGNAYITFSANVAGTYDGLISKAGNEICGIGGKYSINALIPITGW